ncbi:hypothetical protein Tco_0231551 [Tanacetum coccineum]
MGGSSSQPRTDPPLSPINAFSLGDLVEQVATSPTKKKKATRNRQKRVNQTEPAPRQTAWTTEEEIALAKGWRSISENSERGNARKKDGFWVEVLEYMESKTKQRLGRRSFNDNGWWEGKMEGGATPRTEVARGTSHLVLVRSTQSLRTLVDGNEDDSDEVAQREKFMELKKEGGLECSERSLQLRKYSRQT